MGVRVATAKKLKPKATPKKAPAKKKVPSKKETTAKPKTNNATSKPKPVKATKSPKRKAPKRKPVANNTPVKKEVNDVPANDVSEKKESRKRAAPKAENDIPAKKASPVKKKPTRGRPPVKANNVISPKKKEPVAKKTSEKLAESTPAKATNNVGKKQSKAKPAKKSPAKGKKSAAKTPKKSLTNEKKAAASAQVTKAKATRGRRAKKAPAAKTKSVYLQPVIELDPLEHIKALHQVPLFKISVVVPRLECFVENMTVGTDPIVRDPIVRLRRIDQQGRKEALSRYDNETHSSSEDDESVDEPVNREILEERNPSNKKYQPYMEKIKQLSTNEISQFVKNNKELCEKLKDVKSNINAKNDLKQLYKCNPYNSEQQLAMYLTLREIFNVPQAQFKEYRNFFTVIMPELANLLFAQTFRMKATAAPRLIKKLYPNPTSPF